MSNFPFETIFSDPQLVEVFPLNTAKVKKYIISPGLFQTHTITDLSVQYVRIVVVFSGASADNPCVLVDRYTGSTHEPLPIFSSEATYSVVGDPRSLSITNNDLTGIATVWVMEA